MKKEESRIVELMFREMQGQLSSEEQLELDAWRAESPLNKSFSDQFTDEFIENWFRQKNAVDVEKGKRIFFEKAGKEFPELLQPKPAIHIRKNLSWRLMVAASIICILAISTYVFFGRSPKQVVQLSIAVADADLQPATNKALLYLGDNTQVVLDDAASGKIATQGQAEIIRHDNGLLVYNKNKQTRDQSGTAHAVLYNTLKTPKGGQYRVILPDGSKVWLNAASSIRYPTAFPPGERNVTIEGEVYFEVAKKAGSPFLVQFATGTVEVLGTHFNINTYGDGPSASTTTLLEGSVRITGAPTTDAATRTLILKPGQQARVAKDNQLSLNTSVDVDDVLAWKEGYFNIDNVPLREVMLQISRWYDCEVVYKSEYNPRLSFKIQRNVPVSKLLQILHKTGIINAAIAGRTITIE